MPETRPYGVLAEFDSPEALLAAAKRAAADGWQGLDAFSPYRVKGLAEAMGFRDSRLPKVMLAGGVIGAAAGFGMQAYTNVDFPLDIGGRPFVAPEAFALITFELLVLFAVVSIIAGMLIFNRLPKLHHPLFNVKRFEHATLDGFFLLLPTAAPDVDVDKAEAFLRSLKPHSVVQVPPW